MVKEQYIKILSQHLEYDEFIFGLYVSCFELSPDINTFIHNVQDVFSTLAIIEPCRNELEVIYSDLNEID
jgi:hypothetical protein